MNDTIPVEYSERPVAVIGAGTLGRRIALTMANRGDEVRVFDPDARAVAEAKAYIDTELPGVIVVPSGKKVKGVTFSLNVSEAVQQCWLVIEAVPEDLELKKSVFAKIDKSAEQDAILASNSSSYPVSNFVDVVSDPGRLLNVHFQQPPDLNVVEIMSSGQTESAIVEFMVERLVAHGLAPFVARAKSTGFIFNRVWAAVKRECLRVVADGVSTPSEVNEIWKLTFKTADGPFDLMDRVGLDVVYDIERHYLTEDASMDDRHMSVLESYLNRGKLGLKTGEGFFKYNGS